MDIKNASQFPRVFYCRHMQPGTALYEDGEGNETILVDLEGMQNLIASVGKRSIPVYINHQPVVLKNIKDEAAGYVCDSFYNQLDGWGWFKFIAVDDKAHECVRNGWSVSNAYVVSRFGPAGRKNNCPYNREVLDGEFTHLAIVPNPRYEGAMILTPEEFKHYQDDLEKKLKELQNSKERKPMFTFFKSEKKQVAANEVDMDTHVEFENGKSLSMREMIEAVVQNAKKEHQLFDVGGKKMTAEEIKNAYEKMNKKAKMKKNEKKDDDEEVEEEGEEDPKHKEDESGSDKKKNKKMKKNAEMDEEEDCMNSEEDEDEATHEEKAEVKKNKEKRNSIVLVEKSDKYFEEMRNAHLRDADPSAQMITTSIDQIERGRQRYGSDIKK